MSLQPYDTAKITVSPGTLNSTYTQAQRLAESISSDLTDIITALNGLQLSWFGGSSAEMQTFSDQWAEATTALFGTKVNLGAIGQLLLGIQAAEQNYDAAEKAVGASFGQLAAGLLNPGPAQAAQAPTSLINTDPQAPSTFINEVFS
jgi:uncharacterized protein YukE